MTSEMQQKQTPEQFAALVERGDFNKICDAYDALHKSHTALLQALVAAEAALNNIRVCCHHTAWDATGPAVIAARAALAAATGSAQ